MDAVHDEDQPLTSLEFEAGSGDYGGGIENQYDPSTVDLKTRLLRSRRATGSSTTTSSPAASTRRSSEAVGDGNDRHQLHRRAARHRGAGRAGGPARLRRTTRPRGPCAAVERHERVARRGWTRSTTTSQLGLVLDAYATEYHHPDVAADDRGRRRPGAAPGRRTAPGAGRARCSWPATASARCTSRSATPRPGSVLALATGRYLAAEVQQRAARPRRARGRPAPARAGCPSATSRARRAPSSPTRLGVASARGRPRRPATTSRRSSRSGWAAPWPGDPRGLAPGARAPRGDVVLHRRRRRGVRGRRRRSAPGGRSCWRPSCRPTRTLVERAMAHLGTRAAVPRRRRRGPASWPPRRPPTTASEPST